jgi:hypothetical protein
MGKKPTPAQVEWQAAARKRIQVVLERLYDTNQTRLANALHVSHTLVNLVVRAVQPPTRNLMARLGTIEGVNPHWAATGEGEPFVPDTRGTLPISEVLLPGPPASHSHLMTGERFTVAPAFDRPSCYFWRLPNGHPAAAVNAWRLRSGDLLLLEFREVTSAATITEKMCVLRGGILGRADPMYGMVNLDPKGRLVFEDDRPRLRFDHLPSSEPVDSPMPQVKVPSARTRRVRNLERDAKNAGERTADPYRSLPIFDVTHILSVQLVMVRP